MTNDMRKLMEAIDRINENEQTCLRCGIDLFSKEDLLTGICPNCWDEKQDGTIEEHVEIIGENRYDDIEDVINELSDIKEQISGLVYDATSLVEGTDEEDSAKAYWIGHILGALDNESGYIGGSMTTMQDTIDALGEGEDFEDEDEDEDINDWPVLPGSISAEYDKTKDVR